MMRRLAVILGVAIAAAHAERANAQGSATVTGVVFDSLVANAALPGAEVTIDGTDRTATTDVKGRFRIDGVVPGRAVVRFYHASLDSLGFGAPPIVVMVPDTGTVSVRLATPSPASLRVALCPVAQPASSGAVLGRVRDVDNRTPLSPATITASWAEWSIGKGGLVRTERHATGETNANGAFALCGVPNDVAVVIRASAAGHVTGLVEVDLTQRLFAVRDFGVSVRDSASSSDHLARVDSAISRGDSVGPAGASSVNGVVRGQNGKPIHQAQVGLLGFPVAVRTGTEGAFALLRVPAGTQTIDVRAVGFAPKRLTVDIPTSERRVVDVTLDDAGQALAPVNIVGRATRLDRTGFEDRRKAGLGQFITEEEIARRGVFDTEQALWNVLGARVVWNGYENVVRFTRPSGSGRSGGTYTTLCAPAYWVDGISMGRPVPGFPEDVNMFVKPRDIRGIEVYTSQSQAPVQYRQPDVECGVVMIWTKPSRPRKLDAPLQQ